MVLIHTLSAADFKHTMQNNDLFDSTIDSVPEVAVISIGNSADDDLPDDIFANGPSSRWFRKRHRNVLNLTFDDIGHESPGLVLFSEAMAEELVRFVEENHDATTWIVHCSAGVSRSGAVSRWLKDWLAVKYGKDAVNVDARHTMPNPHVLGILDKRLQGQ